MSMAATHSASGLPNHHVSEELLMAYAAGHLAEAESLVVATHLALCPACRERNAELESAGGALLEDLAPAPMTDDGFEALMARLEAEGPANDEGPHHDPETGATSRPGDWAAIKTPIPQPLRGYLEADPADLRWRPVIRGLEEFELPLPGSRTKLLRIQPGVSMPQHSHQGAELTLVLTGSFSDVTGRYARGDLAITDGSVDHQPTAGLEDVCLCLAVVDAPLRLTGRLGRFLNPFVRF
jgi:putative transcriptional regulator